MQNLINLKQQVLVSAHKEPSFDRYTAIINTQENKIRDLRLQITSLTQKNSLNADR